MSIIIVIIIIVIDTTIIIVTLIDSPCLGNDIPMANGLSAALQAWHNTNTNIYIHYNLYI